jgi:hypothetical protein
MNLVLDRKIFIFALICFSHLSFDGLSNMVINFCNDSTNGLDFFLRYMGTSFMIMFLH